MGEGHMRNILIILVALFGIGAFGQTNIPTRQMLADTNGVVKWPTNITSITIGGRTYTNLLGFGLALTNGQLSVDTTQLPAGGGGGGSGTVTSVGLSTSLSGLSVGSSPVTSSGTITLSGTLGLGSGGTGATDAPGARTALSLVPGTDVQAYDADLAAIAALANSGIIVRTGSGAFSARTITGDSEAVVSNGDGVSGNPTLSIGASIARDSEVAAAYQPLDADLTAMAAGTAVATAQTNAVSVGAPVLYVGTTNVAAALASAGGGGGGNVYTSSNNVFTGSNTFSGMVTLGGLNRTNWFPSHQELYLRTDFLFGSGGTLSSTFLPWIGSAISSGTSAAITATSNHVGQVSVSSASGANSGYTYQIGSLAIFNRPGDFSKFVWRPQNTNAGVREYLGFLDTGTSVTDPTDGVCLFRSNNIVYGKVLNNSTLYQTSTSVNVESNTWYYGDMTILSDSSVFFRLLAEDGSTLWTNTLSCSVAVTRGTGHGTHAYYTNAAASVLSNYDFMDLGNYNSIQR